MTRVIQVVPPLSRQAIHSAAESVLQQVCPDRLSTPGMFPVTNFFEFDLPHSGVVTGVESHLPSGIEGLAAPAEPDGMQLLIAPTVYDGLCEDNGRARFTVAHEVGHIHLHVAQTKRRFVEGKGFQGFQRAEAVPTYRNPEWQANVYAAFLLMPTAAVAAAIGSGITLARMALIFGVSRQAMEIRVAEVKRTIT